MSAMKTITTSTQVGADGLLTLEMPDDVAGHKVDVVVTYVVQDGVEEEPEHEKEESWEDFVNRTYGMFADNPIERAPQPPMQERDWLE